MQKFEVHRTCEVCGPTGIIARILQTAEKFTMPDMYQCLLYNVFRGIGCRKKLLYAIIWHIVLLPLLSKTNNKE